MKLIGKFKVDDLGRILLPNQLRTQLGWEIGSEIEMYHDGSRAILQLENGKDEKICQGEEP